MKKCPAAQEIVPGIQIRGPFGLRFSQLGLFHFWLDRTDNLARDLVLQCKDIVNCTIEFLCPEMMSTICVDQLRGNTHAVAAFSNTAFDDVSGRKLARDHTDIARLPFEREAGVACNHREGSPR